MRRILPIIALFSLCGATAQEYIPSYGLERPRSEIRIYPTAEEAAAAGRGDGLKGPSRRGAPPCGAAICRLHRGWTRCVY